ncbi:MAG: DUF3883 domain-containing protein [Bacteroidales bacterium]|jgi:hypothetical protein|nr:DUF3883 domain-containing protein [Bacteroidales bacterium]
MYDHTKQFRCELIRGKSQREIDNMLPTYANIINEVCPCKASEFPRRFDEKLKEYLPHLHSKTLANHRTETAGKLFGMYFEKNDIIYISERTSKFLEDHDQPAFFKDFCFKMQFPNGMSKIQTIQEHIDHNINIRPYSFILKVMLLAEEAHLPLTKKDIGYYILNALDVLQGKGNAIPDEVIAQIAKDKAASMERKIKTPGKGASYDYQHINEQLNYLELANLIIIENDYTVHLNNNEKIAIEFIAKHYNAKPMFDVYSFDLSTKTGRQKFEIQWGIEFAHVGDRDNIFKTSTIALGIPAPTDEETVLDTEGLDKTQIGEEGERYVYNYEKKRVKEFNKRLISKVVYLGKIQGLGYDIQSVVALPLVQNPEFAKYIEVKTTKRVTAPDLNDVNWEDTVYITKNEMDAACQHREYYSIYRVYFCRKGVVVYIIDNVYDKKENSVIRVTPTTFRIDFSSNAVSETIPAANGAKNV